MGDVAEEDIDLLDFFSPSEVRSSLPTNALPKAVPNAQQATANTKRVSQEQATSKPRADFGNSSSPHTGSASPRSTKAPLFPLADFAEAYSGLRVRNRLLSAEVSAVCVSVSLFPASMTRDSVCAHQLSRKGLSLIANACTAVVKVCSVGVLPWLVHIVAFQVLLSYGSSSALCLCRATANNYF